MLTIPIHIASTGFYNITVGWSLNVSLSVKRSGVGGCPAPTIDSYGNGYQDCAVYALSHAMVKGWFGRLGPHYGPRLDLTIMIEHQTGCKNFVCNIYHNHSSIVPDLDLGGYSSSSYSLYSSATLLSFAGNITGVMVFHTAYQLKAGTVHNLWFNVSTYGVAEEWSNPNATLLHAWASTAVDDGSSGQGFSINWIRVS